MSTLGSVTVAGPAYVSNVPTFGALSGADGLVFKFVPDQPGDRSYPNHPVILDPSIPYGGEVFAYQTTYQSSSAPGSSITSTTTTKVGPALVGFELVSSVNVVSEVDEFGNETFVSKTDQLVKDYSIVSTVCGSDPSGPWLGTEGQINTDMGGTDYHTYLTRKQKEPGYVSPGTIWVRNGVYCMQPYALGTSWFWTSAGYPASYFQSDGLSVFLTATDPGYGVPVNPENYAYNYFDSFVFSGWFRPASGGGINTGKDIANRWGNYEGLAGAMPLANWGRTVSGGLLALDFSTPHTDGPGDYTRTSMPSGYILDNPSFFFDLQSGNYVDAKGVVFSTDNLQDSIIGHGTENNPYSAIWTYVEEPFYTKNAIGGPHVDFSDDPAWSLLWAPSAGTKLCYYFGNKKILESKTNIDADTWYNFSIVWKVSATADDVSQDIAYPHPNWSSNNIKIDETKISDNIEDSNPFDRSTQAFNIYDLEDEDGAFDNAKTWIKLDTGTPTKMGAIGLVSRSGQDNGGWFQVQWSDDNVNWNNVTFTRANGDAFNDRPNINNSAELPLNWLCNNENQTYNLTPNQTFTTDAGGQGNSSEPNLIARWDSVSTGAHTFWRLVLVGRKHNPGDKPFTQGFTEINWYSAREDGNLAVAGKLYINGFEEDVYSGVIPHAMRLMFVSGGRGDFHIGSYSPGGTYGDNLTHDTDPFQYNTLHSGGTPSRMDEVCVATPSITFPFNEKPTIVTLASRGDWWPDQYADLKNVFKDTITLDQPFIPHYKKGDRATNLAKPGPYLGHIPPVTPRGTRFGEQFYANITSSKDIIVETVSGAPVIEIEHIFNFVPSVTANAEFYTNMSDTSFRCLKNDVDVLTFTYTVTSDGIYRFEAPVKAEESGDKFSMQASLKKNSLPTHTYQGSITNETQNIMVSADALSGDVLEIKLGPTSSDSDTTYYPVVTYERYDDNKPKFTLIKNVAGVVETLSSRWIKDPDFTDFSISSLAIMQWYMWSNALVHGTRSFSISAVSLSAVHPGGIDHGFINSQVAPVSSITFRYGGYDHKQFGIHWELDTFGIPPGQTKDNILNNLGALAICNTNPLSGYPVDLTGLPGW